MRSPDTEELSETARLDRELEQARSDLRQTLERVNHKVEAVEARLRPTAILSSNPAILPLVAG
jgi:phosphomevalonate kinase